MADKADLQFRLIIHLRLKGKNNRHPVNNLLDFPDPPSSPCPYLRAYIVKNLDTIFFGCSGKRQVKVGVIDQYQKIRSEFTQGSFKQTHNIQYKPKLEDNFRKPDNRHIG